MFKIICVTDRKSCSEDFLTRIEKIAAAKPDRIIFRDKDCGDEEYVGFAFKILEISDKYNVPCSMYFHPEIFSSLHMTMPMLRHIPLKAMNSVKFTGASVHSVSDAVYAANKGVDYVTAGHIFETACKPNLPPKGTEFLKSVCKAVNIPVYAIGGINPENIHLVKNAGADGACIMSGLMKCGDPAAYIANLRRVADEN